MATIVDILYENKTLKADTEAIIRKLKHLYMGGNLDALFDFQLKKSKRRLRQLNRLTDAELEKWVEYVCNKVGGYVYSEKGLVKKIREYGKNL